MNKHRKVNINFSNYLLGFARTSNIFSSEIDVYHIFDDRSRPKISRLEDGNIKEIEISRFNAYVQMFDGEFHQNCYLFVDVSHYWQDYIIKHFNLSEYDKKLSVLQELLSDSLNDLVGVCGNIDYFGKQDYYEVLKGFVNEDGGLEPKYEPHYLEKDLNLVVSRIIKLVNDYIDEVKLVEPNKNSIAELKNFVNELFYRAEQIVGSSRDFYLDSRVERDIINGVAKYKFMEEVYDRNLASGDEASYNQKDVYDYFDNALCLLEGERKKLFYELDQFENNVFGSENEN